MQLRLALIAVVLLLGLTGAAAAQSLSPMHKAGGTPSDIKGFRLQVGNPYDVPMVFIIVPMEPGFEIEALQAVVNPPEFRLSPGASRSVMVAFKIGPDQKERTIGVCVMPKAVAGHVLPRVCGTYTGTLLIPAGG